MNLPPKNCQLCPRLVALRLECQNSYPHWHNAPVPSFGDYDARLAIIGLAPGKKGANRTGRPFTGDYAGDLLYSSLLKFGFAKGQFLASPDDGLQLINCRIMNAVKCLPPENKPTPHEIQNCAPFLQNEMDNMPNLSVILALGHIAHDAIIRHFRLKISEYKFAHGKIHILNIHGGTKKYYLIDSYHCSRYNTQTRRLSTEQFHEIFHAIKQFI